MVMRVSEGEASFNSEEQNEPINPDDCIFIAEWFEFYNEAEVDFKSRDFQFFGFVDPSLGKSKKSDFSAIITLAKHKVTGYMYVLDADIERRHPDRIITDVLEKERWLRATYGRGYKKLGAEVNQFQWFLKEELAKASARAGLYLPIEEVQQTSDKTLRNRVQSNTANYFQYNDEAILKVLKMGDVSSQDIAAMKEKGAIILEDGGDIQWLIKEVSDSPLENYKNRLREDMHIFSNVPNLTDENFGGNLSGVAVSYKLWGIEQICAIKERKFKRGLQRRIELITNMLNLMGGNYDYRDIDIQFRRNKPQNLLEIAQIIQMLADLLSKESRLKMLPDVDNPRDELDKLRDEQQKEMSSFGASGYEMLAKALQTAQEPTPAAGEPKEAVNE